METGKTYRMGFSFALGLQILNSWFSFPVDLPRKIIQMFYFLFYNHVLVRSTLTASLAVPLNFAKWCFSLTNINISQVISLFTFFSLSIFSSSTVFSVYQTFLSNNKWIWMQTMSSEGLFLFPGPDKQIIYFYLNASLIRWK